MIRIITEQNPVFLNKTILAGDNYSNGEGDNAGIFGFTPQTSGQPYGVLANQGGFTSLSDSISKMGSGGGSQQGSGANPMDIVSTLAPLANQLLQKRPLSEVESVCGKQPSFLASKSKKAAWQKCANNYAKNMAQKQTQTTTQQTQNDGNNKMSMTTKIALGVGGVAVLGAIIYLATRKK